MDDETILPDSNLYYPQYDEAADDWQSSTFSKVAPKAVLTSCRYQTLRESGVHVPADEQMFEVYRIVHLVCLIADSHRKNPLFRAPIGKNPKHILDIGTGCGSWPIDVADKFPEATVRGVDLFPPPVNWAPPNCILEVDDILKSWTWRQPFDLIHLRILDCAFTPEETKQVYKQCYDHLEPGGWIEQVEVSAFLESDDGSIPEDSIIRSWGPRMTMSAERSGRSFGIMRTMRASMEEAGFVDVHVKNYKLPIGPWPKDKQLKEIGSINYYHWVDGMEGYCLWLLTKFGVPEPWSKEENEDMGEETA
ncbi:hypothetical protein N7478_007617 [Penicillium angulare]|uniref:uncharacterized protein n=1 Tax=Penicillium angulare TaxID=116970 RepID=UPI0025423A11|nr:uncharacterized protein N7478_007617 [Penicillium angulare]KAJ5272492.1 hypothetical protein N7478_007617 [Penicillium angulare]